MPTKFSPEMEAELVCHDDQLQIWADEVIDALADWIEVEDYDAKVQMSRRAKKTIRDIVQTAFELASENKVR